MINKLICRCCQLLVLLSLCTSVLAQEGTLLVANRAGGSLSMIDLTNNLEVARLPIGPHIPHEVDVSADGRWALVPEYGPNNNPGRHLVVIDIVNTRIVGRLDLGSDSRPHTALFLPDSRRAVATMQDSDQVALVDTVTMQVLRTFPTGGREGHMLRLSPDGTRAYVTSRGAEGTLSVIYLDQDKPPTVIKTGSGAEGLDVSPDGKEIWVANRSETTLSIIDAETLKVIETIETRPASGRVAISSDGLVAIPNGGGGSEAIPQYVRIYDYATRAFLRETPIRNGEPGEGFFGVMIKADKLFVSDPGEKNIQVFDLKTLENRSVFAAELADPDGMAWSPLRVHPFN